MIADLKKDLLNPELKILVGAMSSDDKKVISELLDSHKEDIGITFNDIKELVLSTSIIPSTIVYNMISSAMESSKDKIESAMQKYKQYITDKDRQLISKLSFLPDWFKVML